MFIFLSLDFIVLFVASQVIFLKPLNIFSYWINTYSLIRTWKTTWDKQVKLLLPMRISRDAMKGNWLHFFNNSCISKFILDYRIVEFASYKDLKNVIDKLDGTELNGRKIKLVEDRATASKRSRTASSSRSRSRSR